MTDYQTYVQPALIIAAMAGMLKFLVVDKLTQITAGLSGHDLRIRRQEILTATVHGVLRAKGCLAANSCPCDLAEDDGDGKG